MLKAQIFRIQVRSLLCEEAAVSMYTAEKTEVYSVSQAQMAL
jgi:hypothetical protein